MCQSMSRLRDYSGREFGNRRNATQSPYEDDRERLNEIPTAIDRIVRKNRA
jgi:hypothetical protein